MSSRGRPPLLPSLIELRPRPETEYIYEGQTLLSVQRQTGQICPLPHVGLFVHQTRLLSTYRWRINGKEPHPVTLSAVQPQTWLGYYMAPVLRAEDQERVGGLPQQAVEMRLRRRVGEGMHEDIELTNYSQERARVLLELQVDGDFSGILEQDAERKQQGTLSRHWQRGDDVTTLELDYQAEHHFEHHGKRGTAHMRRGVRLAIRHGDKRVTAEGDRFRLDLVLGPRAGTALCVTAVPLLDGEPLGPTPHCVDFVAQSGTERDVKRHDFLFDAARMSTPESGTLDRTVSTVLRRSVSDLASLRMFGEDEAPHSWMPAAGEPVYQAIFGRDTLTAGWQSSLLSDEMLRGTLAFLRDTQGQRWDAWSEETPDRMIHQKRTNPLSELNIVPFAHHYATTTTSAFFPVALSELWHWTGDEAEVGDMLDAACRCIRWLDEVGDGDGDGFVEYRSVSEKPQKNQAWKDSQEAIVDEDGRQVDDPIATCDTQAFAYGARRRLAELLFFFGRKDDATRLFHEAEELKKRFNDAYWMEEQSYLALALGPDKRQIGSIASNAGHCIAANLVDESLIERLTKRMFAPDLFSGWGIRTLSDRHPAYNPLSYQRGTVWPAEQAAFALGLWRYGLRGFSNALSKCLFEAAELFAHHRLPECFSGHPRDDVHPFPALYSRSNWPQAWSASAPILAVQTMVGLYPFAPFKLLAVDPELPEWLPEIRLDHVRVGKAVVSLRFFRDGRRTDFEVLDQRGELHVVRQPSPWSLHASEPKRVYEALESLAR